MSKMHARSSYEPPSYRYNDVVRAEGQAIFDKAWKGILAQGRKSRTKAGCLYESGPSCFCGVGHNLSPEARAHLAKIERTNNASVFDLGDLLETAFPKDLVALWPHRTLLNQLQVAHDKPPADEGATFLEPFVTTMTAMAKVFFLSPEPMKAAARALGLFKPEPQTY